METAQRHARCPYCLSPDLRFHYAAAFKEYRSLYDRCGGCGSIVQNPPLTTESLHAFYNSAVYWDTGKTAEYIYTGYAAQEAAYLTDGARRYRLIRRLIGETSMHEMSALEIGCGAGFSAQAFLDGGVHVTGVEPSAEMADFARKHYGMNVLCGMFENVAVPPESQNIVYSWGTSMNFRDPHEVYLKALNSLKPGGSLFIDFFDMGSVFSFLTARKRRKAVHASCAPSKKGMAALLNRCGFQEVRFIPYHPFLSFSFIASQLDWYPLKKLMSRPQLTSLGIPVPVGGFYIAQGRK